MSSDLPIPEPTVPRKPFTSFKVISFDIYGTLVDWEASILKLLQPLVSRIPPDSPVAAVYGEGSTADGHQAQPAAGTKLAAKFNEVEAALQTEQPTLRYDQLLTAAYERLTRELDVEVTDAVKEEAARFGQSIGSWAAFPDTVAACQRLAQHYKLVPLSNVDRDSFQRTRVGPLAGVDFWRVYTAQDIGSYKPNLANFEYLIQHVKDEAGVDKDEILHVAQSLFHDHIPAKKMGMSSVWINRKGAGMGSAEGIQRVHEEGRVGYGWRFSTLGEFADEVERQFDAETR